MSIQNIYFIDIETVPYSKGPNQMMEDLFVLKSGKGYYESGLSIDEYWSNNAALYAEFCKIVSISIGKQQATKFYVKTIVGKDEKIILQKFSEAMEKAIYICAHVHLTRT